jgi:hypothetical protein
MLPDMDDSPPEIPKLRVLAAISRNILLELRSPPLGVVFRCRAVVWTAVPEAPINKYGDSRPRQRDVGGPWKGSEVNPVTQAESMKFTPHGQLRSRVSSRH